MKILKLLYLLCVLFLYTTQSYAQQQVNHVYRMDTRCPDEIFRSAGGGFFPAGTNDNIVEHVQEYSDAGHRAAASAFVATTANREAAIEWGVDFQEGRTFYVYDIRPTSRFYSVVLSLQRLYAQTGNRSYLRLIRIYEEQAEYVALGGIAVTQVQGAQEFLYDESSDSYVEGRYRINNLYQDAETTANVTPYTPRSQLPSEVITSETYCALNLTTSRYSARLTASTTHHKYPFLGKLKRCHDSLLTMAFLNASFL
ncbi:enterotoxin A family protein [Xenorhabdus sp. IM139775]|uniref:enterotoxin A family protein n=1 Tax=Xenorhabdus sp. IM139775 TaxID=3025876 RepID=UPI002358F67B|nr:enterotoxin A family protein [Xenorhabdus sp. IM139775]MDC9592404.1 enterotoxin A family protein [Xenorhabdus sp. IM139775]